MGVGGVPGGATNAANPALCAQGPLEAVHKAALALGTANQLTNILRDVGEDALERNRIYVPLEELDTFGISENEVGSQSCMVPGRSGLFLCYPAAIHSILLIHSTLPCSPMLVHTRNERTQPAGTFVSIYLPFSCTDTSAPHASGIAPDASGDKNPAPGPEESHCRVSRRC